MSNYKKFMELVTNDENVKSELENATLDALMALLEAKGLKDEAQRAIECAFNKTAETHGFKLDPMDEISENELQAVAGGSGDSPYCKDWSTLLICTSSASMMSAPK